MKNFFRFLISVSLLISLSGCLSKASQSTTQTYSGEGSTVHPYPILTATDLNAIRGTDPNYPDWGLDKHYILLADIDLSGYSSGSGWVPIDNFTGVLNGNFKKILNLKINRAGTNYQGLFGVLQGDVENLILSGVDITGAASVGGLAGMLQGGHSIKNCGITGTIRGSDIVGGLVGESQGVIAQCYTAGNVSGGGIYIGGLAGSQFGALNDCYSTANVNGNSYVGGLCGRIGGLSNQSITRCYTTGILTGGSGGGLVGENDGAPSDLIALTNSYRITNGEAWSLIGANHNGGTVDLTGSTQLSLVNAKLQASYTGWDFTSIWRISTITGYPELQWQQ